MEFEAQAWANQIKLRLMLNSIKKGSVKSYPCYRVLHYELVTSQREKRSAMQRDTIQYMNDDECHESYSQINIAVSKWLIFLNFD